MKKIVLQAGHENIKFNSIVSLRGSTGAPNELSFNVDIRNQLAAVLRGKGFEVITTDANANDDPNIKLKDFNLFLSIHYDADIYGKGGGFVDFPEPSTDSATGESQRIAKAIREEYFAKTGIVDRPERSNKNTRYYYMWKYISAKTPCVLIECGVGMHVPDDHQVLHFERPRVVEGLARGICKAFGVAYETQADPLSVCLSQLDEKGKELVGLQKKLLTAENELKTLRDSEMSLSELLGKCETSAANWQAEVKQSNDQIVKLNERIAALEGERNNYKKYYEAALAREVSKATAKELVLELLKRITHVGS